MYLEKAKTVFTQENNLHSEEQFLDMESVIGYEKIFRWSWMATQLNTFVVVTDYKDKKVGVEEIEYHLNNSFNYAKKHYTGWPRGLQSALGVVSVLVSSEVTPEAKEYCQALRSGKKWSGFTIPVVVNSSKNEVYKFLSSPMWGAIYYPYFKKLITKTVG